MHWVWVGGVCNKDDELIPLKCSFSVIVLAVIELLDVQLVAVAKSAYLLPAYAGLLAAFFAGKG